MLMGPDLFAAVRDCPHPAAFWWLGQASYIYKLGDTVILFDPYLAPSKSRQVPPLFAPEDAAPIANIVLCSHDHSDHIDPVAIRGLAAATAAVFVAPRAHDARLRQLGVAADRLHLLDDADTVTLHGVTITAVKAAHEFFHLTDAGLHPFLGYVITGAGRTLYHSGDTVWWEGLQARLRQWTYDAVFLPINGRDAERLARGCIGNMVYQEAADLAGGLDVALTVPMHYDMFAGNAEDPRKFVDYCAVKYPDRTLWVGPVTTTVPF